MQSQGTPGVLVRRAYLARRKPTDKDLRLELVLHTDSAPLPDDVHVVLTFPVPEGGMETYREVRRFQAQYRDTPVIAVIMKPQGSSAHLLALTKRADTTMAPELELAIGATKICLRVVFEGSRAYAQEDGPGSAVEN